MSLSAFKRSPKSDSKAQRAAISHDEREEFFLSDLAGGLSYVTNLVWNDRHTFDSLTGSILDHSKSLLLLECQHAAAHMDYMRCQTFETLKSAYNWIEASKGLEHVRVIAQHEKSLKKELVIIAQKLNGKLEPLEAAQLGVSILEAHSLLFAITTEISSFNQIMDRSMTVSPEKSKKILEQHLEHVTFHLPPPTMEDLYKVCESAGEALLSQETDVRRTDVLIGRCHVKLYMFASDLLNQEPSLTSLLKSDVGGDDGTCELLCRYLVRVLSFDEQSLLQRIRAIESGEEKQVKDVKEALLKTLRAQRVMIAKQLNTPPLIALATSEWGGALVNQEAVNMPDFDILSNEDRDEISRGTVPDVEDLRGAVDVLWNFSHDLLRSKAWLMKRMNSTEAGTGSAVLSQTALGKSTFASISTANSFTVAEFDDLLQRLRTYSNLQQLRTYSKAAYPKSYAKVLSSLQKCLEERRPALRHILVRIEENPHYMFYQTLLQLYRVLLGLVVVKFVLDHGPIPYAPPSNAEQKRSKRRSGSQKPHEPITTWAEGAEIAMMALTRLMTQELPSSFWSKIEEV